jgi:hypothetical protein
MEAYNTGPSKRFHEEVANGEPEYFAFFAVVLVCYDIQ